MRIYKSAQYKSDNNETFRNYPTGNQSCPARSGQPTEASLAQWAEMLAWSVDSYYRRYVLSLEIYQCRSLNIPTYWGYIKAVKKKKKKWLAVEIRPGSETISKVDWGNTETQESLPPPQESRLKSGLTEPEQSRFPVSLSSHQRTPRKDGNASGIQTEGNRRKGEGRRQS